MEAEIIKYNSIISKNMDMLKYGWHTYKDKFITNKQTRGRKRARIVK